MKLLTYKGNTHALQSLIIAHYNGIDVEVPPRRQMYRLASAATLQQHSNPC